MSKEYDAKVSGMRVLDEELTLQDFEAETGADIDPYHCTLCGSPAEWISDEGVWRHKGHGFDDRYVAQIFCDKYGYPIQIK